MNKLVVAVALVALAAHVSADITDTDNVAERLADLDRFIKVDACILAIGVAATLVGFATLGISSYSSDPSGPWTLMDVAGVLGGLVGTSGLAMAFSGGAVLRHALLQRTVARTYGVYFGMDEDGMRGRLGEPIAIEKPELCGPRYTVYVYPDMELLVEEGVLVNMSRPDRVIPWCAQ